MENIFRVSAAKKTEFLRKFSSLVRRASKLGVPEPTYEMWGPYIIPDPRRNGEEVEVAGRMVSVYYVRVAGVAPKLNGWVLAGTISPLPCDDGTTIPLAIVTPGETLPVVFQGVYSGHCDHCRAARPRKSVYVLRHESGKYVQVGSTCLHDFLGSDSPENVAARCDLFYAIVSMGENNEYFGGGGSSDYLDLLNVFAYTAAELSNFPWVSASAAREIGESPTKEFVLCSMHSHKAACDRGTLPTDAHFEEAEAARAWGATMPGESDYCYSVRALCTSGVVPSKGFGVAVSIIPVYRRELAKAAEAANRAENPGHFGEVKKRYSGVEITPVSVMSFESNYGYGATYLVTFLTREGHRIKWFASNGWQDFCAYPNAVPLTGRWFSVKLTVKSHETYKGTPETLVNRVVSLGEIV